MTGRHCDMAACKLCSRRTVVCPRTGETFTCRCCGSKR